jgi:hypothetical protein
MHIQGNGFNLMQGGFQYGRSTMEMVASLHQFIGVKRDTGNHVYMVFFDIQAAFDTVDRNILWQKCRARGINSSIIKWLSDIMRANKFCTIGDGVRSNWYHARAGVPQGSVVSPFLYNLFIDDLFALLKSELAGDVEDWSLHQGVPALGFADDLVVATSNVKSLRKLIRICEKFANDNRFVWSVKKTKLVSSRKNIKAELYGEPIEQVADHMYLGIPMDAEGINVGKLVDKNLKKHEAALKYLNMMGANGHGFSAYRSVYVWKSIARPCLEYGLSLVSLNNKHVKLLDRAMMMGLRQVLSISRNVSTLALRYLAGVESYEFRQEYLMVKCWHRFTKLARRNDCILNLWANDGVHQFAYVHDSELMQLCNENFDEDGAPQSTLTQRVLDIWKDRIRQRFLDTVDSNLILKDLPTEVLKSSNWLKTLTDLPKAYERKIIHWLLGSFPMRTDGLKCGICNQIMPVSGRRAHLTRCAAIKLAIVDVVDIDDQPIRRTLYRRSHDPLTILIWNRCFKRTKWKEVETAVDTIYKMICEIVDACQTRLDAPTVGIG